MSSISNSSTSNRKSNRFTKPVKRLSVITLLMGQLFLTASQAEDTRIVERAVPANQLLKDSWVINYQADDFSDEIKQAKIIYIPKDITQNAAFFIRCEPYFANFSVQYVEQKKNLMDDGSLPNASSKYAKHGYVYDDKQEVEVIVDGDNERYELSIGGQNKHLTKLFKTDKKIQPEQLGMSFFFSFTFKEMPSFRQASTSDEAESFFKQLNTAITSQSNIQFHLETENGWQRQFDLDTKRMLNIVPSEVLEFCVTKRSLK